MSCLSGMAKGKEQRLKALLAAVDAASASQAELAHEAGISESSVYLYRMGIRHPSPETMQLVLKALEKRQKKLAGGIERLRKAAG